MVRKNFTLLELSVVLLIIVTMASLVLSVGLPAVQQSTEWNLNQKMQLIEEAISGNPSIRDLDGSIVPNGYVNDMGAFPDPSDPSLEYSFQQLLERLGQPNYINHDLTLAGKMYAGWNGPYLTEAGYSKLKNIIQIELVDDDGDGNDDIRIFANGYSELERYIYWKDCFKKRNITISGIPDTFTAKVTMDYKLNGILQSVEQDISGSAETAVDLPKGTCAFYAELVLNHEVLEILAAPPASPDTGDVFLVAASGASGDFMGHENEIATWNGVSYDFAVPSVQQTLHDKNEGKYYQYETNIWVEKNVDGTKTPQVIKTIKTDIVLTLE